MTLSVPTLRKSLTPHLNLQEWEILCFETLHSTNTFLKTHPLSHPFTLCCAEEQTAGRGRGGKIWTQEAGKNLAFSVALTQQTPLAQLQTLSLVVGIACAQALTPLVSPQLKWPNDLIIKGKKLGGILVEVLKAEENKTALIIGIGLNINHAPNLGDTQRASTCLSDHTSVKIQRHEILTNLLVSLIKNLKQYERQGWSAFRSAWNQLDALVNQAISFKQQQQRIQGVYRGVDERGRICIESPGGEVTAWTSGEVEGVTF